MEEEKTYVVISKNAWDTLNRKLDKILDFLYQEEKLKGVNDFQETWIESVEARKMLKVSPKTWQTYRDRRIIPFAQIGRKILVKKSDIEKFLSDNYIQKQ